MRQFRATPFSHAFLRFLVVSEKKDDYIEVLPSDFVETITLPDRARYNLFKTNLTVMPVLSKAV
jgi:hypothetical protein